jgi:hypothetical protein
MDARNLGHLAHPVPQALEFSLAKKISPRAMPFILGAQQKMF